MTDQSSTIRFIEDNWLGGQRIGQGSFDSIAGSINNMFDFSSHPNMSHLSWIHAQASLLRVASSD